MDIQTRPLAYVIDIYSAAQIRANGRSERQRLKNPFQSFN